MLKGTQQDLGQTEIGELRHVEFFLKRVAAPARRRRLRTLRFWGTAPRIGLSAGYWKALDRSPVLGPTYATGALHAAMQRNLPTGFRVPRQ
jgi:hypothetical protein